VPHTLHSIAAHETNTNSNPAFIQNNSDSRFANARLHCYHFTATAFPNPHIQTYGHCYTLEMTIQLGSSPARRNVELKAKLPSLETTRSLVQPLATTRLDDQHQVDIYFCAPQGRLKLRTINKQATQLIWYSRPDSSTSKTSHYVIARIDDPEGVQSALTGAFGVRCRVDKHREIYLCDNVRVHLDTVAHLGDFLEFEAVLDPEMDPVTGHRQIAALRQALSIADADLIQGSYVDLIEANGTAAAQLPLPPISPQ